MSSFVFCFDFFLFIRFKKFVEFLILFFCNTCLFFSSLPNREYSNLVIAAAFSAKSFSDKKSFPVKNSYLLTFPDDKAEIVAVCLSKSY